MRHAAPLHARSLALALSLGALGTCRPAPAPELALGHREAMRDSVEAFLGEIPEGLAAEGPMAWMRFFEDSATFYMASNGLMAFPSPDSAVAFLQAFAPTVSGMSLRWDDLRVEPLAPGIATIGARYHEVIEMADGTRREFAGYVSGVARNRSGEWRLQHLHWSSPLDPAG